MDNTNIYIGNRYVPIFADPINWTASREYEPLTIVLHNGYSYTSKKMVPLNTDISNTEYWALTGNYNAQVEQYRQEVAAVAEDVTDLQGDVDQIQTDVSGLSSSVSGLANDVAGAETNITALQGRVTTAEGNISTLNTNVGNLTTKVNNIDRTINFGTIVMIGDSYLEGYSPDGNVNGWGDRLAGFLGKTIGTTAYKYYKGGCGFGATVDSKNFNTLTNDAYTALSAQANIVGAVIYVGGANEPTNLTAAAVYNTLNNAKAKFPNAKIFYAYGTSALYQTPYNRANVVTAYEQALASVGKNCFYLSDLTNLLKAAGSGVYASDGLHLNNSGQAILATAVYNGMYGMKASASRETHQFDTCYLEYIMNDMYTLECFQNRPYTLNVEDYYANGSTVLKTLTVDTYVRREDSLFYVAHTTGYIKTSDDVFHDASFAVRIFPDKLEIYAYALNAARTNYLSGTITAMEMTPFTYTVPVGVI